MNDNEQPQGTPNEPSSAYARILLAHLNYCRGLRDMALDVSLIASLDQEITEYEAKLAALGAPDQGSDSPVL